MHLVSNKEEILGTMLQQGTSAFLQCNHFYSERASLDSREFLLRWYIATLKWQFLFLTFLYGLCHRLVLVEEGCLGNQPCIKKPLALAFFQLLHFVQITFYPQFRCPDNLGWVSNLNISFTCRNLSM